MVLGKASGGDQHMMTVSEGLDEMKFPPGFAAKVENTPSNAYILAQALNNNDNIDKNLSYKLTVGYLDDAAAEKYKIQPLRTVSVAVMGKDAEKVNGGKSSEICRGQDEYASPTVGKGVTPSVVHFDVPPGRHEYRSLIDKGSSFYLGGTIHYIKLHLHPYGESISLVDKTAGKTLWQGKVSTAAGRAALTDVDYYSSAEGIVIDTTHDYEVVSVYNNTTNKLTDAMAVLRVYISGGAASP